MLVAIPHHCYDGWVCQDGGVFISIEAARSPPWPPHKKGPKDIASDISWAIGSLKNNTPFLMAQMMVNHHLGPWYLFFSLLSSVFI